MTRIAVLCLLALPMASCATDPAQDALNERAAIQAQAAADDSQCRSYGAQAGSDAYVHCRMNLSNQRAAADENTRALAVQAILSRGF